MSEEVKHHHIWCNGLQSSDPKTCRWCSGPNGLHALYPMDCSPEELVKKHFPDVVARPGTGPGAPEK